MTIFLIHFSLKNLFLPRCYFQSHHASFFATLRTSPLLKVSQLEALHPVQQFLFLLPFAKNINVWQIKKMHFISSFFIKGLKDVQAADSSLLLLLLFLVSVRQNCIQFLCLICQYKERWFKVRILSLLYFEKGHSFEEM